MSIFDTPLYKESIVIQLKHAKELHEALKQCCSEHEWQQCLKAYSKLHWAEMDALGQRHGLKPMEWPIP